MTIVSYAQNFEDVMLWRALQHIDKGFYIDVGANDPSLDSVTRLFYDFGWNGINIEPIYSHFIDLQLERERDRNLQCAAGSKNGAIEICEYDVRGWATASQVTINQHISEGKKGTCYKVPVRRLADICKEFVQGDIHFLKIDVEGYEKTVLQGMDFSQFRPWILVIEATAPNSTKEMHNEWEEIVSRAGYLLAYCDGLNRFYVSKEHSELLASLHYPPNIFDEFIRSEQLDFELQAQKFAARAAELETRAQIADVRAAELETRASNAESSAHHWWQQANQWHERVLALHNSTSWTLTKPLRAIKRILGGDFFIFQRLIAGVIFKFKTTLRAVIAAGIQHVFNRPDLRARLSPFLKKFPWLHQRLLRVRINSGIVAPPGSTTTAILRSTKTEQFVADTFAMPQAIHVPQITSHVDQVGIIEIFSLAGDENLDFSIDEILRRIRNELGNANEQN